MKREFIFAENWAVVALSLPLILVLLAAAYGASVQKPRFFNLAQFFSDYPIRIDLADVELESSRRALAASQKAAATTRPDDEVRLAAIRMPAEASSGEEPVDGAPMTADTDLEEVLQPNQQENAQLAAQTAPRLITPVASRETSRPALTLPVDFDLAGGPDADNTLQLQMQVQHANRSLGRVEIRIDNTSAIFVSRREIGRIIPVRTRAFDALEGEFVLLTRLRDAGVDLRYDPVSDRLVLAD